MEEPGRSDVGARFLIIAASIVVLIAGLRTASALILPFLVAVFVAMISLPLLNWLQARRVPGVLAVALTILADVLVLAGIGLLVGGSVQGFTEKVPQYQSLLSRQAASVVEWLRMRGFDLSQDAIDNLFNPGVALDLVTSTLQRAASLFSNLLLVFLTVIFLLFEATGFPAKLQHAFRNANGAERFERITRDVLRYLAIKTVVSLATAVIIGLTMWLIGVPFPLLWGLLAFLLNYVPSLGSILAAIPPVLLAWIELGPGRAVAVAITFAVVNVVIGNFIEPHFMGRRLGLSTLVVFLSLVFWGWVWGPVGMLLSVPLTMVLKIMLENTEDLRWVATLLDSKPRGRAA